MQSYVPILIAFVVATSIALILQALGALLGPKRPNPAKGEPFECGIPSQGTIGERNSVQFFLVAVLFLLFDVEAVFLFPWATVFREFLQQGQGAFLFLEMAFFLSILALGLFYVWKKGALRWE